jgi:hypothetical protein
MLKGNITIGSVYSNHEEAYVSLRVEDGTSSVEFLEVKLSYEAFAHALTGRGHVPCEIKVRGLELIGRKRLHKTVLVPVPDGNWSTHKKRAERAIKELEVDGWHGRVDDALNNHNLSGKLGDCNLYKVVFVKHEKKREV